MIKHVKGCIALMVLAFMFTIASLPLYAQTIGYEISSGEATYTNSDTISASETKGDDEDLSDVWGVYSDHDLDYFFNTETGSISAFGQIGNSTAAGGWIFLENILGIYIEGTVASFTNEGSITASAQAGDASGEGAWAGAYDIYGTYFNSTVETFINSGSISASAQVGSASGDNSTAEAYEIYGTYFRDDVGTFTNEGSITVSGQAGDASGDGSVVWRDSSYGVAIGGNVDSFVNTGDILVNVNVGDASGADSSVSTYYPYWNAGSYAVYIGNNVDVIEFENYGNIQASIQAGNATGDSSSISAGHILGVDIGSDSPGNVVDSFINEGNIGVFSQAGDAVGSNSEVSVFTVNPVWIDYSTVNYFENSGDLVAYGQVGSAIGNGSYVSVYDLGIGFLGEVSDFVNTVNIITTAIANEASGDGSVAEAYWIYGTYFDSTVGTFTNSGSITASAQVGDASGDDSWAGAGGLLGTYFLDSVGTFTNSGSITASAQAGDASGNYSRAGAGEFGGVGIEGDVDTFVNSGSITASAQVGDASGDDSWAGAGGLLGTSFLGNVGTFTNRGSITAITQVGSAIGDYSRAEAEMILGTYFDSTVGTFTNNGSITASAQVGDASGYDSEAEAEDIYGTYFDSTVGTFTNNGSITASAQIGDASGTGAQVTIGEVCASFFNNGVTTFKNEGTITASVVAGSNASIEYVTSLYVRRDANIENNGAIFTHLIAGENVDVSYVGGIAIYDATSASIRNTGNVYLSIDLSSGSVNNAAGIYIVDSTATIFSPGPIYLYSSLPNADIRTLRIESYFGTSSVTFDDSFSVVFGSPGITKRPIYVGDGSTLNLNGATLVAYAGDDLIVNHPYYVIESQGTVTGRFGGLEDRVPNPDIFASWYGADKGENAAVSFHYDPQHSTGALGVWNTYRHSIYTFDRAFEVVLRRGLLFSLVAEERRPVLLASASGVIPGVTKMKDTSAGDKTTFFVSPYYFYVDADDLKYDADNWGFQLGLERRIGEQLSLGLFGGVGWSEIDFKKEYDANSESQNHQVVGVYGLYRWDRWFGGILGAYWHTDHDYDGRTGPNLTIKEKDEYDSYGFHGRVLGGYEFEPAANFRIALLSGFSYSHWHAGSHTTEAANPRWNKHYGKIDEDFFNAMLGMNLTRLWIKDETRFLLEGGLRIEQALTDNDVSVKQSIPGIGASEVKVKEDIADTSVIGRLGLSISKGRMRFGVSFEGEYNDDYQGWSGLVDWRVSF